MSPEPREIHPVELFTGESGVTSDWRVTPVPSDTPEESDGKDPKGSTAPEPVISSDGEEPQSDPTVPSVPDVPQPPATPVPPPAAKGSTQPKE